MSKLIAALKEKYKTPEAALQALGLDMALLKSAVVGDQSINHEKETIMSYRFTVATPTRDVHFTRRKLALDYAIKHRGVLMAYDASSGRSGLEVGTNVAKASEIIKKYDRGVLTERDAVQQLRALGYDPDKINNMLGEDDETNTQFQQEQYAGPGGEDDDTPHSAAMPELVEYLQKFGWSDEDIEEACRIAAEAHKMSMDEPEPFSGRPNPGGQHDPITSASRSNETNRNGATDSYLIFKQNGIINSRNIAMAFAAAMQRDNSVPVQHFNSPTQSKQARRQLASDAARSTSSRAMADTYSRFPGLAKIGRA